MIKNVKIGEQNVPFKISASFAYRYKNQFGEDVLQVIFPMLSSLNLDKGVVTNEEVFKALEKLEITTVYNIIWVMAKTADNKIEEPEEWYDSFDVFPLADISKELFPMFIKSLVTTKDVKKK